MADAAESCNMGIGQGPNSYTKVTPREQGALSLNNCQNHFK